jgi:hypothetical protein
MTVPFPEGASDLAALSDVVLDAELLILHPQGHTQFDKLRRPLGALKRLTAIELAAREEPAILTAD